MTQRIRDAFREQAGLCRAVGSPFTAALLDTLAVTLDEKTQTGKTVLNWPGEPMRDALSLRIIGGLHALARTGQDEELTALYARRTADFTAVLTRVVTEWDSWLLPWLDSAPQTNEVGRSAVLWPGVMEIAQRFGPKVELLELGASAGLNLNMDCYGYDLGGVTVGVAGSAVQLRPDWTGPSPARANVDVVSRRGVDLNPLDVSLSGTAARLLAYVWPDQPERLARIAAAIEIARAHPPCVDQADGADWIEARLGEPQDAGVTRIVYHSIALQYFPTEGRQRVIAAIKAAGARATRDRPLAWLSLEFTAEVTSHALLRLQCWPGTGTLETLAHVHPHGTKIEWLE